MPKNKVKKISEYDKGYAVGYRQGYKAGSVDGFEFHAVGMMYCLADKFKFTNDAIKKIHDAINDYVDMVKDGFIDFQRLKKAMVDTFNITFTWKDKN